MGKKAYVIFFLLLAMLAASVYSIATVSGGASYVAAAQGQTVYELDVARSRGVLYDCRMTPLVSEKRRWIAAVAPTIETVGALEKATGGKYRSLLAAALENGKPFLLELDRPIDDPCIDLFSVPERYSNDQPAPHVVGSLDSLGAGISGVELAMDDVLQLHGGEAKVLYQVDALGRVVAGGDRRVVNTLQRSRGGVALTLDARIQRLAEQAGAVLGKGAVVVTEVPNCQIRAMASFPGYSPADLSAAAKDPDSPLLNRALCAYAPGSVFKLAAAAAALEAGTVPGTFICTGSVNAGGMAFQCIDGTAHGPIDLKGALERSCNCYFINCVRSLGGQSVLSTAYNLGLGMEQEFGRGLFSAPGDLPDALSLGNARALANFSFGQGEVTVTPLQMCGMVNAIASGGIYSSPKLIAGTVDEELALTPVQSVTDRAVRVMSLSTAAVLQSCMEGCAVNGTGRPGAPASGTVGIKTGTAQTGIVQNGQELLHFWYCGYLRDSKGPRYCISVLAESTPDDRGAAAQAFKTVAEGLQTIEK